ncbi:unnamed protein product, partial [Rotaria magnacalcarata]
MFESMITNHNDSFLNETTYYTDAGPDFAGSVEQLSHIKRFYVKILPNEPTNDLQSPINHPLSSIPTVQCRLPNARSSILNTSNELSILSVTSLTRWYSSFTRLRDAVRSTRAEYSKV